MWHRTQTILCLFLLLALSGVTALAQNQVRSPTETTRMFYQLLREKKFREAFALSTYRPAVDALTQEEFEDFRPDFEKMAVAINERITEKLEVSGEQVSGDAATVFLKMLDADGNEKVEPVTLIKVNNQWILGTTAHLSEVQKAGKRYLFDARINAHHDDVQDMLTRISLGQVLYSQNRNGQFGNMAELIGAGVVPKDIETPDSTGYRFQINRSADGNSWYATAEPAQYGRTGKLSFYLDASGVRSGDNGGKPLVVKSN